jgi:hypothetical protein
MYIKNGWPWAGLINTKLEASKSLVEKIISIWNSTDWGDNFQNYRRPSYQGAIYPHTRTRQLPGLKIDNELQDVTNMVYDELKPLFKENMVVVMAEINCLIPKGIINWHHDRMAMCYYGSRIILPLFNLEDVIFSFSSWNNNTPIDRNDFSAKSFMDTDIVSTSINSGTYYIFNHRVPHCTVSLSDKPRAMYAIDLVPEKFYEECSKSINGKPIFKEISNGEKTKIIPTIM